MRGLFHNFGLFCFFWVSSTHLVMSNEEERHSAAHGGQTADNAPDNRAYMTAPQPTVSFRVTPRPPWRTGRTRQTNRDGFVGNTVRDA